LGRRRSSIPIGPIASTESPSGTCSLIRAGS
jgi:hypothetical protein